MPVKNTPPTSPSHIMDNLDVYEDDVEEIIEENNINDLNPEEVEDLEYNEEDFDDEDDMSTDDPARDDADLIFDNHTGSVFCCDIEPKLGQFAVTGGEDDRAFVWDINSANIILECKGHSDSVIGAEFSHDGTYVATGDMKGTIQVWKMSTKTCVWDTNTDELLWLKWHPAANVLLVGTDLGDVYVYKVPSGEFKILAGHGSKSNCGVVMPDGKRLAVGYNDGTVKVFDIKMTNTLHRLQTGNPDSDACITCMDASSDNNLIITGSLNGEANIITTQNGKIAGTLSTVQNASASTAAASDDDDDESREMNTIESVAFCKDSSLSLAAAGNLNGVLCIWDVSRQVARHSIKQTSGISRLIWDRNPHFLYAGCLDSSVKLYDVRSGEIVREFLGHRRDILDIAISRDGNKLLATSDDKSARVFSTTTVDR
ncbi:Protein Notchless [Gryllus bimaculatus]|nr:Protein Notchless [Gryllus bimaculatus]